MCGHAGLQILGCERFNIRGVGHGCSWLVVSMGRLTPPFSRPPAGATRAPARGVTAVWGGCNGWLDGRRIRAVLAVSRDELNEPLPISVRIEDPQSEQIVQSRGLAEDVLVAREHRLAT